MTLQPMENPGQLTDDIKQEIEQFYDRKQNQDAIEYEEQLDKDYENYQVESKINYKKKFEKLA